MEMMVQAKVEATEEKEREISELEAKIKEIECEKKALSKQVADLLEQQNKDIPPPL